MYFKENQTCKVLQHWDIFSLNSLSHYKIWQVNFIMSDEYLRYLLEKLEWSVYDHFFVPFIMKSYLKFKLRNYHRIKLKTHWYIFCINISFHMQVLPYYLFWLPLLCFSGFFSQFLWPTWYFHLSFLWDTQSPAVNYSVLTTLVENQICCCHE